MQAREEHVRLRLSHTAHELLPQQPLLHTDRRQRVLEQVALRRLRRAEHGELVEQLLQPLTKLAVLTEHQRPHAARRLQRSLPGPHRRGLHTEALSVELSRLPHHLHPPLGLLLGDAGDRGAVVVGVGAVAADELHVVEGHAKLGCVFFPAT